MLSLILLNYSNGQFRHVHWGSISSPPGIMYCFGVQLRCSLRCDGQLRLMRDIDYGCSQSSSDDEV